MDHTLRGSRKPARWWVLDPSAKKPVPKTRARHVVGRCRICGNPVHHDESYHQDVRGLAHLWCGHGKR